MIRLGLLAFAGAIVAIDVILGFKRGLVKTFWRLITLIAALPFAVMLTRKFAARMAKTAAAVFKNLLSPTKIPFFGKLLANDSADTELLLNLLLMPILFYLCALILRFLSRIVYKMLASFFAPKGPNNKVDVPHSRFLHRMGGFLMGVLIAVLGITVWISPVLGYLDVLHTANTAVTEAGGEQLWSSENDKATTEALNDSLIKPVYGLTGEKLFTYITEGERNGEKITLKELVKDLK